MKTRSKMISGEKLSGRVYTPSYIVENILDLSDYYGEKILLKHVIDNSCGDGIFLCEIVSRYCLEALRLKMPVYEIAQQLSEFIHVIDMDKEECKKCKLNLLQP